MAGLSEHFEWAALSLWIKGFRLYMCSTPSENSTHFTRSLLVIMAASVLLASCRSTVPQPTRSLSSSEEKATYTYKMHNNAPLRSSESHALYFVDLNLDGNMDLLVGGSDNVEGFHTEMGDGTGNWETAAGPATSMQPLSFASSDINHNDKVDILIGGRGDQKGLQVWEFDPENQSWTLLSSPLDAGIFSKVAFVDVNRDGWDDIIASKLGNNQDGGITVLLNDANGGWIYGTSPIVTGEFTDVVVQDINGDGLIDIIASRRGGLGAIEEDRVNKNTFPLHRNKLNLKKNDNVWQHIGGVQIWHGDGNGRWEPAELPVTSDAESVTVADVDGDGDIDILAGLYQQGIMVWLNDANQSWDKHPLLTSGTWSDIRVGDFDADGARDLVASSSVGQGLHLWHWDEGNVITHGDFIADTGLAPNFGIYLDIDIADIHNDGTLAIAASRSGAGIEIWSSNKAKPLPARKTIGKTIGNKLAIYFDSGSAKLNTQATAALDTWATSLGKDMSLLHLRIQGRADQRPIRSVLFPNNTALSRARAEAVAAWLLKYGVLKQNLKIDALGDQSPLTKGLDPSALKQNRRVSIQAFNIDTVRLPKTSSNLKKRDLYNVTENRVFKTIGGVPEYKVGPGDELSITFWQGGKSETKKVIVQIDGTVSLPYQSALEISGYTPREIDALITDILKKYERNPRVDIFIIKARSKYVSIFGEVQSLARQPTGPGNYALRGRESLVDFLSRVGGPGRDANLNAVQIIRNGKTIILNLNKAIRQGDLSENAIVDAGDTIFIPSLAQSKRQVYVLGEVNKTGIVEFIGDINFLDAISQSGGLTPDAYLADIRVIRSNREQPEILPVDFERFMEKGDLTQIPALMDKDIIIIPSRPIANWNKYIADISPTITLLLQPVSIAQQILTLKVLSGQIE